MNSESGILSKRLLLENQSRVCRVCLKLEENNMVNLFENKWCEDFYKFTGVQVLKSDGLTELLCQECNNTLRLCKKFRIKCQKSDIILKDLQKKADKTCHKQSKNKPTETCTIYEVQKSGSLIPADSYQITTNAEPTKSNVHYKFTQSGKLLLRIIPEITELNAKHGHCQIKCPKCESVFKKLNLLVKHIVNNHENNVTFNFKDVITEFYCPFECNYNINSGKNKYFTQRTLIKQHALKVHTLKQFKCSQCENIFPSEASALRHEKSCKTLYDCKVCTCQYKTSEALLVHLLRKHPENHKEHIQRNIQLKKEMKRNSSVLLEEECVENDGLETSDYFFAKQKKIDNDNLNLTDKFTQTSLKLVQVKNNKKNTVETQTFIDNLSNRKISSKMQQDYSFDSSPKRTFATQTIFSPFQSSYSDVLDCVKNDITLGSWVPSYKTSNVGKNIESPSVDLLTNDRTNTFVNIETQTALDELLYSKYSRNGDDDSLLFSELVSLSDIQTQTAWPSDFSMDNSIKQTIGQQTKHSDSTYSSQPCLNSMSPDLSYKETQTHFSFLDSPCVSGFSFPKSLFESANSSPIGSFASIETQTLSRIADRNDVLLSFNTMETQTYFDNVTSDHATGNSL